MPSVFAARQFINHGHILVNGKRVNIPSYSVQDEDVIEVKTQSREIPMVLEALESSERDFIDYISVDVRKMQAKLIRAPKFEDVPYPVLMEPNLVIEFYSR